MRLTLFAISFCFLSCLDPAIADPKEASCSSLEKGGHEGPVTVVDAEADRSRMPKAFRTTTDTFQTKRLKKWVKNGKKLPSRQGMERVSSSASGQFSDLSFRNLLKILEKDKKLYVIDLRQESHGFASGHALSFYGIHNAANKGLSLEESDRAEANFLKDLKSKSPACVYKVLEKKKGEILQATPLRVYPAPVQSEKDLVESYGAEYRRFKTLDHWFPDAEVMTAFIEFVRSLPDEVHLHFHCRGGKGRASQFMIYYDILKNAPGVELEDILERQYLVGGKYLKSVSKSSEKNWKQEGARARMNHVHYVYEYARDPEGYQKRSWKEWLHYKKYTEKYPFSIL